MIWLLTTKYHFRSVGKRFYCGANLFVRPDTTSLGKDVFIGSYCHLAVGDLSIGNHVMLAPQVAIVGGDHHYGVVGTPSHATGRRKVRPVVIEDDVWVGYGSIIMHGVTLGEGCVVAAGSVLTKDVPPYEVWGGVPAEFLKVRFSSEEDRSKHRTAINV